MNKISLFGSLTILLLIPQMPMRQGISPLRYHTYLVADVEALVKEIHLVDVGLMGQPQSPPEKYSRSGDVTPARVQKISLKIAKIRKIELNRTGSPFRKGDIIELTNQYLDQKPPFAAGQTIRVRIRLVLPEERYNPKDPRREWWFYPPGEPESVRPSRLPFAGIRIVRQK